MSNAFNKESKKNYNAIKQDRTYLGTNMANENNKTYAVYTDDSGVVISQAQYAELHGETPSTRSQTTHNKTIPSKQNRQKKSKTESDFQKGKILQKQSNQKINNALPGFEKCPFCWSTIKSDLLHSHIKTNHPAIDISKVKILNNKKIHSVFSGKWLQCPLCNYQNRYQFLFTHIESTHTEVNPKIVMAKLNREIKQRCLEDQQSNSLDHLVRDYEKLHQSQDEPRDAGKYAGYMSRENGKFGSLPLYDNYSDEASSD